MAPVGVLKRENLNEKCRASNRTYHKKPNCAMVYEFQVVNGRRNRDKKQDN
jgi:hypothetical protein